MDNFRHDKCLIDAMLQKRNVVAQKGMKHMIEIVYNKDEHTQEDCFTGIELPKNIRQIGMPQGNRRIYIEDYVMTYLKQLSNPNSSYARGAILVGECVNGSKGEVIFISGALAAQNLELDLGESSFDGETWSYIYQEVKNYFPDLSVVGWFLSRMGFSTEVNDKIVQLHMDNFAGNDKVLFIMDSLENEEAFYMMEEEGLHRQSGYYIYYVRNEAMQNFMIESKTEEEIPEETVIKQKDEAVVRNYKKIMEERARSTRIERANKRLSYVCAVLMVMVFGLGVAVLSNYRMLEKVYGQIEQYGVLTANGKGEDNILIENDTFAKQQNTERFTTEKSAENQNYVTASTNVPKYYTVQDGDTLSSISFKMYNSVGYVAELMEANELGEADAIHEGECIVIPTIRDNKKK